MYGWEDLKTTPPEKRRIDVWWWCDDATSQLTLLLAYLMMRSEQWGNAKIRVLAACFSMEADERILGGGDFVTAVLKQAGERL